MHSCYQTPDMVNYVPFFTKIFFFFAISCKWMLAHINSPAGPNYPTNVTKDRDGPCFSRNDMHSIQHSLTKQTTRIRTLLLGSPLSSTTNREA